MKRRDVMRSNDMAVALWTKDIVAQILLSVFLDPQNKETITKIINEPANVTIGGADESLFYKQLRLIEAVDSAVDELLNQDWDEEEQE